MNGEMEQSVAGNCNPRDAGCPGELLIKYIICDIIATVTEVRHFIKGE